MRVDAFGDAEEMANQRITNGLAGVVTVAAWVWLYLFFHPRPPGIDRHLHAAVGERLAQEAGALREPGARLIVLARAPEPFQVPAAAAQLEGFLRAVKKSGQSPPIVRPLALDPLRVVRVPPGDFYELMRQGQDKDVIVSFLGPPPVLDAQQLAKLGARRPRILAVCSGAMPEQVDLAKIFGQKLLLGAVVERPDRPGRPTTDERRSSFDKVFKWITPANLSELPTAALNQR